MNTEQLLIQAEQYLVLNKFVEAEQAALDVLKRCQYLPACETTQNLRDQAGVVLVQALYETKRFPSARHQLNTLYNLPESDWPINTLLLWLSLELDSQDKGQAQSLILCLLETKTPGSNGWTRRRYLALLHLYIMEVLVPCLRDPSEAKLWLNRQTFLPLDPQERQFLEDEVDAIFPGGRNFDGSYIGLGLSQGHGLGTAGHHRRSSACLGNAAPDAWLQNREEHLDIDAPLVGGEEADDDQEAELYLPLPVGGCAPTEDELLSSIFNTISIPPNTTESSTGHAAAARGRIEALQVKEKRLSKEWQALKASHPNRSEVLGKGPLTAEQRAERASKLDDAMRGDLNASNNSARPSGFFSGSNSRTSSSNIYKSRASGSGSGSVPTEASRASSSTALSTLLTSVIGIGAGPEAPVTELDWLGRCQRTLFGSVRSIYESATAVLAWRISTSGGNTISVPGGGPSSAVQPGVQSSTSGSSSMLPAGGKEVWSRQAVVGTAAMMAVLVAAYAAYKEREEFKRTDVHQARRGVLAGVGDLMRMGLSLSPNPMTAPR